VGNLRSFSLTLFFGIAYITGLRHFLICGLFGFKEFSIINETNYDTIFGKIAVEQGLCTNAELRRAVEELKSRHKLTL